MDHHLRVEDFVNDIEISGAQARDQFFDRSLVRSRVSRFAGHDHWRHHAELSHDSDLVKLVTSLGKLAVLDFENAMGGPGDAFIRRRNPEKITRLFAARGDANRDLVALEYRVVNIEVNVGEG